MRSKNISCDYIYTFPIPARPIQQTHTSQLATGHVRTSTMRQYFYRQSNQQRMHEKMTNDDSPDGKFVDDIIRRRRVNPRAVEPALTE